MKVIRAVGIARQLPEGSRSPRITVARCLAADSTCWPTGAARLGRHTMLVCSRACRRVPSTRAKACGRGVGRRIGVL